jgi:branched-chain amino acid transport system ATP-binding protein
METESQPDNSLPLINIEGLTKDFRGLRALDNIYLSLSEKEIMGVIGPNGAGKTTLFNMITSLIPPTKGKITFLGIDITNKSTDTITRLGIARTFQNIRLFGAMSVLDNVRTAQQLHTQVNPVAVLFSTLHFQHIEEQLKEKSLELLRFFSLDHLSDQPANNLPYGSQRRLEIARALATQPRLLLLDEPTVGMNPSESQELLELILQLRQQYNLTIILVAHDMQLVMGLCQHIHVLNQGKTIAEGTPAQVRIMSQVIEAYLGSKQRA